MTWSANKTLIALSLFTASQLSAGIISVNLVDVNASDYDFQQADVVTADGFGRKLYGWADSGPYMWGFDRLWIDLSVLNGTASDWVSLTWDFTISRQEGSTSESNDFWFGVTDYDGNILTSRHAHADEQMTGLFWIPYPVEANEVEVRLHWWGTEPFRVTIPNNSIDFTPGAGPSEVPEPASFALVAAGLAAAAWRRRRRA